MVRGNGFPFSHRQIQLRQAKHPASQQLCIEHGSRISRFGQSVATSTPELADRGQLLFSMAAS